MLTSRPGPYHGGCHQLVMNMQNIFLKWTVSGMSEQPVDKSFALQVHYRQFQLANA